MAKHITDWRRFNAITTIPSQTSPYSGDNIIGSGVGTASLEYPDLLELNTPSVKDSDGNLSTFSSIIPENAIITGIQYQAYIDHSNGSSNSLLRHKPKIGSTLVSYTEDGATDVDGTSASGGALFKFKSSIVNEDLGLGSTLSLSNVDDIRFKTDFILDVGVDSDFYIIGNNFEDTNGPSPAVRLEYEIRPRTTIVTGKVSITSGKIHIS